jgi:glycosyltransferase involved in cell wall biosynthesis
MLRDRLERNGFEIGVHDLHHDGHLFRNRQHFQQAAARINRYLREWRAVGFRAGFMLRRLEWLHDLDILYDASTFDTDPFEPMPDGAGMIFPFWVPAPTDPNRGYVELPYTLVQDSTLFLLLEEKSPEIWLRKLDWIAEHGGMVLVNVHPDYIRFPDEPDDPFTFPVEYYERLLTYVRDRYAGQYWHALPREVARYVRDLPRRPQHCRPLRVAMVTHSVYRRDNRVIRYAEALVEAGNEVEVLGLRSSPDLPKSERLQGVQVRRLQDRFSKTEKGPWPILRSTTGFLIKAALHLAREHHRRPYDLIHVHNVPDFLVWAALYPRLRGARVILDIHDILPEFFCGRFGYSTSSPMFRLQTWIERLCARCADHIIVSNHLWHATYAARTGTADRSSVFINHVNMRVFRPDLRVKSQPGRAPILIFPGGLQEHQGLDIAIRALPIIRQRFPGAELHIYGEGPMREPWEQLARSLHLDGAVRFHPPVTVQEIARIMAGADVGIVPKRADSFGNEAYSTKIMEFMALGVPVVASETRIDRYYFSDDVLRFFRSGDPDALAEAVVDVLENMEETQRRVERALAYARAESWEVKKHEYLALVSRLCGCAEPLPVANDPGQGPPGGAQSPVPALSVADREDAAPPKDPLREGHGPPCPFIGR